RVQLDRSPDAAGTGAAATRAGASLRASPRESIPRPPLAGRARPRTLAATTPPAVRGVRGAATPAPVSTQNPLAGCMGLSFRLPSLVAAALAAGAVAALTPSSLPAQAAGTVQGVVQEAGTLRPLPNMQVFVPSAGRGTLTNAQGRYMLLNVPAGEVQLQAQG